MASTPRSGSGDRLRRRNSAGSRERRSVTSRTPRRKSTPLDRMSVLLLEANEISQCLQKHYTFVKEGDEDGDDPDAKVKVINKKLGLCCIWPVSKLKERLIRMRRLVYQSDTETSSLSTDAVFFDPTDNWVKDEGDDCQDKPSNGSSGSSTSASPVPGRGRNMHSESDELPRPYEDGSSKATEEPQRDPCGTAIPRAGLHLRRTKSEQQPADTQSLPGEAPTADSAAVLPEKYLTGSGPSNMPQVHNGSSDAGAQAQDIARRTLRRGRVIKQEAKDDALRVKYTKEYGSTMVNGHGGKAAGELTEKEIEVACQEIRRVVQQTDTMCQTVLPPTTPALTLCRHLVESIRDRLQSGPDKETLLEKVLYNCECLKIAVINILEAHAQGQDSQHGVYIWSDNNLMRTSALHLVTSLDNLTSHMTCWIASLPEAALAETFGQLGVREDNGRPPSRLGCEACMASREGACTEHSNAGVDHLHNAQEVMGAILHSLALDLAILLQFAEQDDDSEVHESASRIFDHIYDICRRCGQLSIATDEQPKTLWNTERQSLEQLMSFEAHNRNDPFRPSPGCDIKQSFLSGSDVTVQKALEETLQTAADCEKQVRILSAHKDKDEHSLEDILKHTYVVVATTKVLVQRTMQVQKELGMTVHNEPDQPDSHYNAHFTRSIAVLTHASQLSDALTLLGQACTTMVTNGEPSNMKKVGRCGEIVLKSSCRLAAIPGITGEPNEVGGRPRSTTPSSNLNGLLSPRVRGRLCVSVSLDAKSDHPLVAVLLSPTQVDGLERAVTDVNTAVTSLLNAIQCHLPADLSSSRSRRMLPVVPARPLVRSNSAKQASSNRRRLSRDLTSLHLRHSQEV